MNEDSAPWSEVSPSAVAQGSSARSHAGPLGQVGTQIT